MRDVALLEPDALLVRSTREKADLHGAGLHGAGIAMQGGRIVNALEDRLRWQALMQAHLEIAA